MTQDYTYQLFLVLGVSTVIPPKKKGMEEILLACTQVRPGSFVLGGITPVLLKFNWANARESTASMQIGKKFMGQYHWQLPSTVQFSGPGQAQFGAQRTPSLDSIPRVPCSLWTGTATCWIGTSFCLFKLNLQMVILQGHSFTKQCQAQVYSNSASNMFTHPLECSLDISCHIVWCFSTVPSSIQCLCWPLEHILFGDSMQVPLNLLVAIVLNNEARGANDACKKTQRKCASKHPQTLLPEAGSYRLVMMLKSTSCLRHLCGWSYVVELNYLLSKKPAPHPIFLAPDLSKQMFKR